MGVEEPGLPVLVVVEGTSDIHMLKAFGSMLHQHDPNLPDLPKLEAERRLLFIPVGGSNVADVAPRLVSLHKRMFMLLDQEVEPETSERQRLIDHLNRCPGCLAQLTGKRALENYLHPSAIIEATGIELTSGDHDDVTGLLLRQLVARGSQQAWSALSRGTQKRLRRDAKKMLTVESVQRMTVERLIEQDPQREIVGWLQTIERLLVRDDL